MFKKKCISPDDVSLQNPVVFRLRRHIAWNLFGIFSYSAAQWGIFVVLAKLGTVTDVGHFTLALAVCGPVFMLTNLQLRALQVTDATENYRFSEYLGLRFVSTLLGLVGIVAYASFQSNATKWVVVAIALSKSIESMSDIAYGLLQNRENTKAIALSLALKGVASISVIGLILYLGRDLNIAVAVMALSWLLILVLYDLPSVAQFVSIRPQFDLPKFYRLMILALPLGMTMMLISLQANVPRYFLNIYADTASLGAFGALAYLVVASSMVTNSLGQVASAQLSRYWANADYSRFKIYVHQLCLSGFSFGFIAFLVSLAAGEWALSLLYGPEYSQHNDVLSILLLGLTFSAPASLLGYGMTAAGILKAQPILFLLVTVFSAFLSWFLIPTMGLHGAAWSSVGASVVQFIGTVYILQSAIKRKLK